MQIICVFSRFRSHGDVLMITQKWMLCWSLVCLKRKCDFKWIEFVISLLFQSSFSIKNQWSHIDKFSLIENDHLGDWGPEKQQV